jgi:hypothetical protein
MNRVVTARPSSRRWWARFGFGTRGATALAFAVAAITLVAPGVATASTHVRAAEVHPQFVKPAGSVHAASVRAAATPSLTAPFNECPAIGEDTSCALLIVITNNGIQILADPSQGPYDGSDDTLFGVVNESSSPQSALQLRSPDSEPIFGFDGDGICTYALGGEGSNDTTGTGFAGDGYCTTDQLNGVDPGNTSDPLGTDYQGPDNTYSNISSDTTSGQVNFDTALAPNGGHTYFSLEESLTLGDVGPQSGYYEAASDGGIFAYDAPFFGSMGGTPLNSPVVGITSTPDKGGYWEVAADGGLFAFGDAGFFGSTGGLDLNSPIVGMASTPDGKGYWLVAADGGIFNFGDAAFFGSMGGKPLSAPVVGIASTADGLGYWMVGADGAIYNFGDAHNDGSMVGIPLVSPVVGIAADLQAGGYWETAADGGIFNFGGAPFLGSIGGTTLNKPVVGIAATLDDQGYWESATDGGIFSYGDAVFWGSTGNITLNAPVVGIASGL